MIEKAQGIVSLILSIISFFSMLYVVAWKIGRIELKIDIMWDYTMRRGQAEVVNHGYGTKNSPITIYEDAKEYVAGFATELKELYKKLGPKVNDRDLFIAIEQTFGERLLNEVCIKHKMERGACIWIALAVAKEQ